MRIFHFCAAIDPWNGMANTAMQFVAEERAAGHDSLLTNDLQVLAYAGKFDRLHIHGTWLPVLWKAAKLAKKVGAEVIVRPAGNYDPVRLKHGIWKRFKKWAVGPWERAMLRRADVIQATCEAEVKWIADYGGSAVKNKIEITDLKRFFKLDTPIVRPKANRNMKPLHVLFLGRANDPLKGVKYLELAVSELNYWARTYLPKCPKEGVVALRIVSNHKGEELERDWDWCDVLCLPTLSENFGRVIAEAIEHGRSVITTDGAPAWKDFHSLTYLRGFRNGTDAQRVTLLKDALREQVEG